MNTELQALIGFIMPPIIDLINTRVANQRLRYIISLLISLLLGVLFTWDQLNWQDVLQSATIVFAASQTTYNLFWKDSQQRTALKARIS